MYTQKISRLLVAVAALLACTSANADIITLFAQLTPSQEVITAGPGGITPNSPAGPRPFTESAGGPLRPASFGFSTFVIDTTTPSMTVTSTIFNIDVTGSQTPYANDNLRAAHIHAPAGFGQAAPVVWGFFGAPDNDNNPDSLVVTPFATGVGGVITAVWDAPEGNNGTNLAAQLPTILAARSYINFHTAQFPGGEIRGQVIPEPSSLALLGLALAAFGLARKPSSRV